MIHFNNKASSGSFFHILGIPDHEVNQSHCFPAKSRKTNPADEEKMKKVEHENLFLKLRVNELENEMVRDPRGKK